MSRTTQELTPFGLWLQEQPRGVQSAAVLATGLAYTTILAAKTRRVTAEVARLLSHFTKGAVGIADMEKAQPRNRRRLVTKAPRSKRAADGRGNA